MRRQPRSRPRTNLQIAHDPAARLRQVAAPPPLALYRGELVVQVRCAPLLFNVYKLCEGRKVTVRTSERHELSGGVAPFLLFEAFDEYTRAGRGKLFGISA